MNIQSFWQKRGVLNRCLWPLSVLYRGAIILRRSAYALGIFKTNHANCPVVCVGNLTVGGSGKTPFTLALAEHLLKNNIQVAVISRGYGGSYYRQAAFKVVEKTDASTIVGDEPLMFKLRLNCPVVVARERAVAAKIVCEQYPEVQIILCDDGLQHWALFKDLSIAVVQGQYGFGNGYLLPAGPLREPVSRLAGIDFIVYNGQPEKNQVNIANQPHNYYYELQPRCWVNIHDTHQTQALDAFLQQEQLAVISGIAHPDYFFAQVRRLGVAEQTSYHRYPDHHAFILAELPQNKTLLMTEKDFVKLKELPEVNGWYLACDAKLSDDFLEEFDLQIADLQQK